MMEEKKERRVLSGTTSSNTCAFCGFHKCALTPHQVKKQRCLGKQCNALIKHEHPFWQDQEDRKAKRRARKERLEQQYRKAVGGEARAVHTEKTPADRGRVSGHA